MGSIIRLILGLVLLFTSTSFFSVLADTPSLLYDRPSLQDKSGNYAIIVRPAIFYPAPLSSPFAIHFIFLFRFSNTQFSSFHQETAPPSSTTTAQTHIDTYVGTQTPKSSPSMTACTELHYTPASMPIPSSSTSTQNTNTTICGKIIGKYTPLPPAVFAPVSFFLFFFMGVCASPPHYFQISSSFPLPPPLPPSLTTKVAVLTHKKRIPGFRWG